MSSVQYLLGVDDLEIQRLRHQHAVWGPVTMAFLERLGLAPGWRCLDAGSGPGFVTIELRERAGEEGSVTALDPSPEYLDYLAAEVQDRQWKNVFQVQGTVEDALLPERTFDLAFSRWVLSFSPDPERYIARLASLLRPGGVLAVQDYYYEGISLYPKGGAFERMPAVVKAFYAQGKGDPYVTGKMPGIFRRLGLELVEFHPVCLAGGPDSGVMEWADRFFTQHGPGMVRAGVVTREEMEAMLADWRRHRQDPDAVWFSPLVVGVAGRKGG